MKRISTPSHQQVNHLLTAFFTMSIFLMILIRTGIPRLNYILQAVEWSNCVLSGVVLGRVPWKKHRFTWPLLLFFPLVIGLCLLRRPDALTETLVLLDKALFVLWDAAMIALLVEEKSVKRYLQTLCISWTAVYTMLACLGIWSCLTGNILYGFTNEPFIYVDPIDKRLSLTVYYTMSGEELALSLAVALVGAALSGKKRYLPLWLVPMLLIIIALTMTDTRNAMLCVGVGIGLALAVCLFHARPAWRKALLIVPITGVMVVGSMVGTYVTCTKGIMTGMQRLSSSIEAMEEVVYEPDPIGMLMGIGRARAETEEEEMIKVGGDAAVPAHRQDTLGPLHSRFVIWRGAVRMLMDHPSLLLFGGTIPYTMDLYNANFQYLHFTAGHMHSIPLMLLCELGIGGLLLYLAFVFLLIPAAYRLMFVHKCELWQRMIPLPAIVLLLSELFECVTILRHGLPNTPMLILFASFTFVVEKRLRENH